MDLHVDKLKAVAFDLFGTLVMMKDVPREEIVAYIDHIEQPYWAPLRLPQHWLQLPPFPDVREGLERIRSKYWALSMSNATRHFTNHWLLNNKGLAFDGGTYLEDFHLFKPCPRAYMTLCLQEMLDPEQILMVTANPKLGRKNYGDIEVARSLGMQAILIRNGHPNDLCELATMLGC